MSQKEEMPLPPVGFSIDEQGNIHCRIKEILDHLGLEHTDENQDKIESMVMQMARERIKNVEFVVNHHEEDEILSLPIIEKLKEVYEHARNHPVSLCRLKELEATGNAVGTEPGYVMSAIPGIRVVFSFEDQPEPISWCRHVSVSVQLPGAFPSVAFVRALMKSLGFVHDLLKNTEGQKNIVHLEGNRVVHVLEKCGGHAVSADGSAITCFTCGMTSHNPNDISNLFCGKCNVFHTNPLLLSCE